MPKTKRSYGVALCRINDEKVEVIMIKKRYTYHFMEFVSGRYKKNDDKYLTKLLSNMTYQEKILILGMKFEDMWRKIWLNSPEEKYLASPKKGNAPGYFRKKAKFDSCFVKDSGIRIKNLIYNGTNAEAPWEMPKGHRKSHEKKTDAAIREFKEETNIAYSRYTILWHEPPVIEKYKDEGVTYINEYFLGVISKPVFALTDQVRVIKGRGDGCINEASRVPSQSNFGWRKSSDSGGNVEYGESYKDLINPKVTFRNVEQILEVEYVKWVSLDQIKFMMMGKKVSARNQRLFIEVSRKYRKYLRGNI